MTRLQPPGPGRVPPMVVKSSAFKSETSGIAKMQAFLIAIMTVCLILTVYINLASTSVSMMDMHHYEAAVNQAIEDFKRGMEPAVAQPPPDYGQTQQQQQQQQATLPKKSKIASLSCAPHGGPPDEFAQEMVYWSDVPSDALYASPLKQKRGQQKKYMTFEPDGGGWNNIRMAMETVVGLAAATGRTLGKYMKVCIG